MGLKRLEKGVSHGNPTHAAQVRPGLAARAGLQRFFFYHCARFFNSADWHVKNAQTSALVDIFTGIFDLWGMPLLFAISGASIFFALRPGGRRRFLRDRVMRLLVPLALGILVLAPPQVYLERLTHGNFQGSFFEFLPLYFNGTLDHLAWTGVHLWYLEYLFLFTLVLMPLFIWLKRPSGRTCSRASAGSPCGPARSSSGRCRCGLTASWWIHSACWGPNCLKRSFACLFLPFPVVGYLVFADAGIQQAFIRQRRGGAHPGAGAYTGHTGSVARARGMGWVLSVPAFVLVMVVAGLLTWSYILACFGYGMRYLNANRPLLAYANEAVLPFYILHQPVILLIGYFVIQLALPIGVKYLIIGPLAFGVTLGLYEYGVRRANLLGPFSASRPGQTADFASHAA